MSSERISNDRVTVHLVRHGEVDNPEKILYGRLPGYRLSDRGQAMAERIRDHFLARAASPGARRVVRVVASPMERARQTATPLAEALGLEIVTDGRLIEAANVFEGQRVAVGDGALRSPRAWRHLYNPFRPSWGEPYEWVAQRMLAAAAAARDAVREATPPGEEPGEVVLVSHQMPIWIARLAVENRHLWHDPRRRECALASVTSLHYDGDRVALLTYAEPAADLAADAAKLAGA